MALVSQTKPQLNSQSSDPRPLLGSWPKCGPESVPASSHLCQGLVLRWLHMAPEEDVGETQGGPHVCVRMRYSVVERASVHSRCALFGLQPTGLQTHNKYGAPTIRSQLHNLQLRYIVFNLHLASYLQLHAGCQEKPANSALSDERNLYCY